MKHSELARRILDAFERQVLTTDAVARIVDKAAALVEEAMQAHGDLERERAQLRALERKLERACALDTEEDDELAAARIMREIR